MMTKTKPYSATTIKMACLVILGSLCCNAVADNDPKISDTRKSELTHIVKQDCGSCHGMTLKGGLGSPIEAEDLKLYSVDFITATIIYGRPATAMPAWNGILTKQEARWIAEQLKQGSFK